MKLKYKNGAGERAYELGEEMVIGRGSNCNVPIGQNYTTVSRRHARIFTEDGEFYLMDLGSSNGTFLNGNKKDGRNSFVAGKPLKPGDKIKLGDLELEVIE